jgi:hypothetical protein
MEIVTTTIAVEEIFASSIKFSPAPGDVFYVIGMFSSVWFLCFAVLGVGLYQAQPKNAKKKIIPISDSDIDSDGRGGDRDGKSVIGDNKVGIEPMAATSGLSSYDEMVLYVESIIPSVYTRKTVMENIYYELWKHHAYISIFSVCKNDNERRKRVLAAVELCTATTCFLYLMALFQDLDVSLFYSHYYVFV